MRSGDKKLTVYVYREWNAIYESLNFQYLYSIILQVLIYQLYYTTCGIKSGRSRNGKQDEHSVMKICKGMYTPHCNSTSDENETTMKFSLKSALGCGEGWG